MGLFEQKLAILIDAKLGGTVTELGKAIKSEDQLAVSAERATKALAEQTRLAANTKVSTAALALDAAGGTAKDGSAEAVALAQAQSAAKTAKLESKLASDQLAQAEAKAAASTSALGSSASATGGLLNKLGVQGGTAGSTIAAGFAKVGPAIVALGTLKVLSDGVKNFEQLTGQVRLFQNTTGAGAKDASLLVGQVNALGIDSELAAKGLFKMASSIGDGSTKLGQYGIQIAKTATGNTDVAATFENVRRAYNASTDAATKDGIAKAFAARGGAALLPLLRLSTAEIEKLNAATKAGGRLFSDADVQHGFDLKVATTEMGLAFKGVEISLVKGIIPEMIQVADLATSVANALGKVVSSPLFTIAKDLNPFVYAMRTWKAGADIIGGIGGGGKGVIDSLKGIVGITNDATKANAKYKASMDLIIENQKIQETQEKNLISAVKGEYDAQHSVAAAAKGVESATHSLVSAKESLAKLERAGPVDQKAVASAYKESATASKDYERAVDGLAKAEDALKKAVAGATAEELAQANLNVAEGPNKLAKAQAAVQAATEKLDALQGSGAASASELATAQALVQEALFGVTQEQINQAKAEDDLTKVKQKGTAADPAVIAAQQAVTDARDNVTSATERQRDAAAKLRDAQRGDPEFAGKLAAANDAVKLAQDGVALAADGQMQAEFRLHEANLALKDSLDADAGAISNVRDQLKGFDGYAKLVPTDAEIGKINQFIIATAAAAAGLTLLSPAATAAYAAGAALGVAGASAFGGNNAKATPVSSGQGTPGYQGRASGGPVAAGGTYLVNEHQIEYLHMGNQSGYITPNGPPAGGNTTNNYITNNVTNMSAADIARETAWSLNTVAPPTPTRTG